MKIGTETRQDHPLMIQLNQEFAAGLCTVDSGNAVKGRDSCGGERRFTLSSGEVITEVQSPDDEGGFYSDFYADDQKAEEG